MAQAITYGTLPNGNEVNQYALRNKNGVEARCIDYGCRLTDLLVPDKKGDRANVLLGYDGLDGYRQDEARHGALTGRYANRIAGATFTLNKRRYKLTQNDGDNFLHGSLSHRQFLSESIGDNSVSFTYTSPAGEDGFPGEVWVGVIYTLTDDNELVIDYRATTTEDTYINLTNHSYFNLTGNTDNSIKGHLMQMNAQQYLEINDEILPTGKILDVKNSAFDFTAEKPIGRDIDKEIFQLQLAGGYDHCFITQKDQLRGLTLGAKVTEPVSGRELRVYGTQPAVQFYTGNSLDGAVGRHGAKYNKHSAFCLETQGFPDAPNQPHFPSTLLKAGHKFHEIAVFHLSW